MRLASSILVVACAMVMGSNALAHQYGMAGCGLGSMAWGDSPGWFDQTSAATTNGTFATQGFGITSGTSNCTEDGKVAMQQAQEQFVQKNLRELSKEIAQGDGVTLKAFSRTFECQDASYGRFADKLKTSYSNIFSNAGAEGVLDAVRGEIAADPELSHSCSTI